MTTELLFERLARVVDAIALPAALVWLVYRIGNPQTSLVLFVVLGGAGIWALRRLGRACSWERPYKYRLISIALLMLAIADFLLAAHFLSKF